MIKIINRLNKQQPFYKAIFLGLFVWLTIYLILPATNPFPFLKESFFFILINLTLFVIGYSCIPLKQKKEIFKPKNSTIYIVILCFIAIYVIRYYDIFILRQTNLNFTTKQNRQLLEEGLKYNNFILTLVTLFKSIYFFPLILYFYTKKKNTLIYIISILIFLLPFPEAFIRGSRNQIFESIIILFIIHLYFNKFRFNFKNIVIIFIASILLLFASTKILHKRERVKNLDYNRLVSKDVIYNQLLTPKPWLYNKIKNIKNETLNKTVISAVQVGQYYCHSVFEFNYLVKNHNSNYQYGKFNLQVVYKFTNHYKLTHVNLDKVSRAAPRLITYITIFGGLYIDFGWYSIIIFFILGMVQKFVYNNIYNGVNGVICIAFTIFFIYANFFLLTVNFYKTMGLYTIFSLTLLILLYKLFIFAKSIKYKKLN